MTCACCCDYIKIKEKWLLCQLPIKIEVKREGYLGIHIYLYLMQMFGLLLFIKWKLVGTVKSKTIVIYVSCWCYVWWWRKKKKKKKENEEKVN